jgi:SAM-dependent methyltransferase/uncharacterized protein YbaR (Trm112 family)
MWASSMKAVVCPCCKTGLELISFDEPLGEPCLQPAHPEALVDRDSGSWVETGVLSCSNCKTLFPVHWGVPMLLIYSTEQMRSAEHSWPSEQKNRFSSEGFRLPRGVPPAGELLVAASFSTEWQDYDYGAVLWTAPTSERLEAFRGECGLDEGRLQGGSFLEVGCGLGILTNASVKMFGSESWGMDLSSAVFRAARQFRENPSVHFVMGSVFSPPFQEGFFDFVYSHGVLHHTWNTRVAVESASRLVSPAGSFYVWLYGVDDVEVSWVRRLAYGIESAVRPVIARLPGFAATVLLLPLVPVYQIASVAGRRSGTHGTVYTATQALHAARDRFSPLFAHRHRFEEVAEWFRNLGYTAIVRVGREQVSSSWATAMERNVALRAKRGN